MCVLVMQKCGDQNKAGERSLCARRFHKREVILTSALEIGFELTKRSLNQNAVFKLQWLLELALKAQCLNKCNKRGI